MPEKVHCGASAQGASLLGIWSPGLRVWSRGGGWWLRALVSKQLAQPFWAPCPKGRKQGVVWYHILWSVHPQFRPLTETGISATPWYPQGAIATLGWVLEQMLWSPFLVRAGKLWGRLALGKPMQPNQVRF